MYLKSSSINKNIIERNNDKNNTYKVTRQKSLEDPSSTPETLYQR